MRGEYKVPGGKLVSVELELVDGHFRNVRVAGDFFLEPDSALGELDAALEGLPATTRGPELAAAISARLGPEVEMIGFDAAAVGVAVRRAVGAATRFEDHVFDVIEPVTLPPVMHVALDEVLTRAVADGERGPLFRIWDWDSPLVVIGSYQSYKNEIDEENAKKFGIGVVRRVSGGGAMFMEPGNCITYSLVVPTSLVEGMSFIQSYAFLDAWVVEALGRVGVKARYVPINDIASDKGKIGGAAQRRLAAGVVLHHATMAYDIDAEKMVQVIRIGREKLSDKGVRSAVKRVDPMKSQTGMTRAAIIESLLDSFRAGHSTRAGSYRDIELERARELVRTKFSTDEWTRRVP